ncbi:unnamed protein product [Aureobasidium vineae]|uniref:Major facilitator superfamily (MFS) profile domain-containing protein n=1 Tax=Aureobasidium vineae TaxID=2773715 RepID=A0A9N8P6N5_9PEZI|nr:unnamed protein product [Aureobasidium vineae]
MQCNKPAVRVLGDCVICGNHFCVEHLQEPFHACPSLKDGDLYYQRLTEAEDNELAQLLRRIDFEQLGARASSVRNGIPCRVEMPLNGRDTRYLMMGGMNLHVRIIFEDKITWIARIRRSNATSPPPQLRDRILKSEIQTLLFLEKTNIPTPKVWGYALEGQENPVGVGYILMDCMPGKVLDWSSASQERKRKIIAQLADIYIELRKHSFSMIGAIEQADEKRVGPLARECLTDFASSDIRPLGPFANLQDYYRASIGLLLDLIHREEIYTDSPTDMYLLYRDLYEIVPELYPETAAAHVETYLKHADDKGSHVLVDDEMNITGVIDWEWAYTTAERVAFISPMLLLPVSDFFKGQGVIGEEEELFAKCLEEKGVEDMAKFLLISAKTDFDVPRKPTKSTNSTIIAKLRVHRPLMQASYQSAPRISSSSLLPKASRRQEGPPALAAVTLTLGIRESTPLTLARLEPNHHTENFSAFMANILQLGKRSWLACMRIRSSVGFITLTVSLAVFTDIFLYGVLIPVIPFVLTSRIGLEETEVQKWASVSLAVYGAAMFCASPICGWATDHVRSRRTFLLVGLVALGAATSLLLVARSLTLIIIARALQGISAAVVWVAGPALLADSVDPDQIGYFMGFIGDSMGLAIIAAPAVGGVIFERIGYNALFYVCLGLIGLDVLSRLLVIEKERAREIDVQHGRDEPDVVYGSEITAAKQEKPSLSPVQKLAYDKKASAVSTISDEDACGTVTDTNDWRGHLGPLLALVRSSRLAADLLGCLVQATLFTSFESILPLQMHETFRWGSLEVGLIFLPLTLPSLTSPLIGWLTDRYHARWPCIIGFTLAALSLFSLRFVINDTTRDKVLLCSLVASVGLALTLVLIPLMADIILTVNELEAKGQLGPCTGGAYGQAYALFNMSYAAGSAAGPLLAGMVRARMGWGATTLILCCLSGASIIPMAFWAGASRPLEVEKSESAA